MIQSVSTIGKQKVFVTLLFLHIHLKLSVGADFDRNHVGVVYGAYVKNRENGEFPGLKTYNWIDIKTMLEVVAGKFSKVVTYGVGSNPKKTYERYVSYYDSNKQAYAAEAAASINKERNATALTILVGVWEADTLEETDIEIRVAGGSAAKANEIYPGTALGIVFSQNDIAISVQRASLTLEAIKKYKDIDEASLYNLKFGTRQTCTNLPTNPDNVTLDKLENIQRNIIAISDFIICNRLPEINNYSDPEHSFLKVKTDLFALRNAIHKINPKIEVMGETGWPSKGSYVSQNVENLQKYWTIVNDFAVEYNYQMWMYEAFDNPLRDSDPSAAYYGWWKLTKNSKVSMRDGYVEKMMVPVKTLEEIDGHEVQATGESSTQSTWVYMGTANGVVMVLFLCAIIILHLIRVKKLKKSLTKADLEEFMSGFPNHSIEKIGSEHHRGKNTALQNPYDTSYEISRDKITMQTMLGSGQFGFVFKATIVNDENEATIAALKMPKDDCPISALKGFLSEIKILIYLGKHENIVGIKGAYTAEILNGIVYIATEFCCTGSLQDYLRDSNARTPCCDGNYKSISLLNNYVETNYIAGNSVPEVKYLDMVRWSYQIANGMEYLGTKHVVHADLATRNVLLTADKTAKITDFGLSRRLYEYTTYIKTQQEPLPWRWMSIEALKRLEFSSKSDVWSYGVTLWEIFSMGDIPYPGQSWSPEFADSLEDGMRMKCPPHASSDIFIIMASCWLMEPSKRPTFTDLKLSFCNILNARDPTYDVV